MSSPQGKPNPGLIFDTLNAYQRSASLTGAIDLDLFTAIGEGHTTVPAIAKKIGASERGTRILSDYLTIIGFLSKRGAEYSLTPDSATFLDKRSPAYFGGTARFLSILHNQHFFDDVAAIVRKGGTVVSEQGTVSDDNPVWIEFARSMGAMAEMPSQVIADMLGAPSGAPWKVLDIAAGHGLYGIAIAQRNPNARVVALDWAPVLAVAKENAAARGVADRFSTIAGSAFDVDLQSGYDLVLLTNFLHHFDAPTNEGLLRKIRASLNPGGRVATLDFVPNDDRVSPPLPASFSLMMLGTTAAGDSYTFDEYTRMFANAGFRHNEIHDVPPQSLIISTV